MKQEVNNNQPITTATTTRGGEGFFQVLARYITSQYEIAEEISIPLSIITRLIESDGGTD